MNNISFWAHRRKCFPVLKRKITKICSCAVNFRRKKSKVSDSQANLSLPLPYSAFPRAKISSLNHHPLSSWKKEDKSRTNWVGDQRRRMNIKRRKTLSRDCFTTLVHQFAEVVLAFSKWFFSLSFFLSPSVNPNEARGEKVKVCVFHQSGFIAWKSRGKLRY